MRKTKDWEWTVAPNALGNYDYPQAQLSVLMDIRDEMKRMNDILHCSNFIDIPRKLDRIRVNTAKKRKPRAVGKPKLRVVGRS